MVTSHASPWLRSVGWDAVWLQSSLWLIPLIIAISCVPPAAEVLVVIAVFLLWLPHRFATTFNAWCCPAYRELLVTQRLRFVVLPAAVLLATFAFVFAPPPLVPWSSAARVQLLATLFLAYNSWHFAMQHFGMLSIYRQRAGQRASLHQRRWERGFCLAVGLVAILVAQIGHGAEVVASSAIGSYVTPSAVAAWFDPLRLVVPVLVLCLWGVFAAIEWRQSPPSWPRQLYVAGMSLQAMLAYWLPAPEFFLLWGTQHWLVSIGLAGHMARQDDTAVPTGSRWYQTWHVVTSGFLWTVLALTLLTIGLVPFFELSVHPENAGRLPVLGPLIVYLLSNAFWAKFFIALNFGTVYVHFVMDRAVFRFSDPATRQVTGRLLFGTRP